MSIQSNFGIFLIIILLVYYFKPPLLFDDDGKRKQFGLGYTSDYRKKTMFDVTTFIIIISILLKAISLIHV
jgi:hypothetical protein